MTVVALDNRLTVPWYLPMTTLNVECKDIIVARVQAADIAALAVSQPDTIDALDKAGRDGGNGALKGQE